MMIPMIMMPMITMAAMTTDGWIKIGVCWGFIAVVVTIMIITALIDRKMSAAIDRKKNLKNGATTKTTTDEDQPESPEARDRRMKELYEKVWGPERKREELERRLKDK